MNDSRNEFKRFYAMSAEMQDPALSLGEPNAKQLVWDYLKINMSSWNSVCPHQKDISKKCNLAVATVSRTLQELEKKGFIEKDGKDGITNRYFLNPHFIWKGEAKDHRLAIAKWDKIQQRKQEDRNEF